jgi:hypothetical protein
MASDKGKILMMNIGAIPKSAGIDLKKFMYFLEANKIGFMNPNEEGKKGSGQGDIVNMVKEIDMSLVSNIQSYISIAEYIERKCGSSIGVTPQMEAQIGPNEAVSNTKQNLQQSSFIVRPYFDLHNTIKTNVLQALADTAKVAYSLYKPQKLSYILDDMSMAALEIDEDLLESTSIGIFVANATKADEAKKAVEMLGQAALQNQQAELGDIVKIIRADSIDDAEELLEIAQQKRREIEQMNAEAERQARADELEAQQAHQKEEWAHEAEMIVLKESERRETEIQKQTILSLGFNEDKDIDDNKVPDVLEVAKHGVDASMKERKQTLDERKFEHDKEVDKQKLKNDEKKINKMGPKPGGSK